MDPAATSAANAWVAAQFPTTPTPGDANYAAFQKAWMDTYIANGGAYTEQSEASELADIAAAQEQSKGTGETSSMVEACPHGGRQGRPGFTPPATPCPCTLTSVKVTCSHGRSAKNDLLQVVSDRALQGDPLEIIPSASGDCATNLVVRTSNMNGPSESHGPKRFTANPAGPSSMQLGTWGWHTATPSRSTIEATTCGGNSQIINVERFPAGESKFQFNFTKFLETYTSKFKKLPIDNHLFTQKGDPRKRRQAGEAKAEDFTVAGLTKRAKNNYKSEASGEIVLAYASGWKEEKKSNLVYCECAGIIAADPLWEAKTTILLYGISVPSKIKDWFDVTAGLFLIIEGKLILSLQLAGRVYPEPRDEFVWDKLEGTGGGEIKFTFEAAACIWKPKLAEARGSASVGASMTTSARWAISEEKVYLDTKFNVGKCTASVTVKFWWGLFDTQKEWQIWEGYDDDTTNEILDFSK